MQRKSTKRHWDLQELNIIRTFGEGVLLNNDWKLRTGIYLTPLLYNESQFVDFRTNVT